ncbi:MFS transporter [Bacteriovoracaceae bacterium]|nr:MFS transporter [Bacteriovoracaceae bacterium]
METAIARTAFYMTYPFIAIHLAEKSTLNLGGIGAVLSLGPLMSTVISFYIGYLSDLIGRKAILFMTLILWSLIFLGFSQASTVLEYSLLMAGVGLARGIFEPVSAALQSDLAQKVDPSGEVKKNSYHLRYFAINIGAGVGPLIGAALVLTNAKLIFVASSIIYLFSAVLFLAAIYYQRDFLRSIIPSSKNKITFGTVVQTAIKDKKLLMYLTAYFFISMSLSQIDSTFPLFLNNTFAEEGKLLFARLVSMNGFIVVLCSLPLLSWSKNFNINIGCFWSTITWAVGIILFAIGKDPFDYYVAMVFITLGEIIVFANGYLLIENLAPEEMKASYLSTINLSGLGFAVGPVVGATLYEWYNVSVALLLMSSFLIFSALIYLKFYYNDLLTPQDVK